MINYIRKHPMTKKKKFLINILSVVTAICFVVAGVSGDFGSVSASGGNGGNKSSSSVSDVMKIKDGTVDLNSSSYFDSSAVYKLPDTVQPSDDVSIIVEMNVETVKDAFDKTMTGGTLKDFVGTKSAEKTSAKIASKRKNFYDKLDGAGIDYVIGEEYDTLLGGFEITIKASDFKKVTEVLPEDTEYVVSETYAVSETKVVTNDVDVYDTGIFDSSSLKYQGAGVVVAVLDTGLDYTHTAFLEENFKAARENDAFTLSTVASKINGTAAARTTAGLTAQDVYVSRKVPYAYDYADKDSDVQPINSEHGTHVAGIIAGNDDTITGVAPEAQLAIMKVFSDSQTGAKTSWILAALEDCVKLGVDVINMSLGTSCGFSREEDEDKVNEIYDTIKEQGVSLIVAASNDYNATMGSKKNGNNGLTSNPDSGTVGSPATYPAALSVASVDGVKTPYLKYGNEIIYFNEASVSSSEKKNFVNEILANAGNLDSKDFDYVTIPGVGRDADYAESGDFYHGKIVLVKRGETTFEEKVRIALKDKGAAGIIIYNNVSGSISMSVGKSTGPVCSIAQDEGEMLASAKTGKIRISKSQVAGPFMSDFSSWGPTSDLKIKPEITAHGGEILSAVPGQEYERLSGTSMAAPNQAGAAALIRQYVKYSGTFGSDINPVTVTSRVNQLMMSTADIVYNKNGLPYAVRKQGAGLVNMTKATTTAAYLTTFDVNGAEMDKSKLELGDDKTKSGKYQMTFAINNLTSSKLTYDVGSIVMTEGVSKTYTGHDDTTVTQEGYLLNGKTTVTSVEGGTKSGNAVTVNANGVAKVTVEIVLSDADKAYLNKSFEHGMYVEGFITLKAQSGTKVDMNLPFLAFYGDWTEAPVFDEEYYDTNPDEINKGIDENDKLMEDAYATRVIGGLYSDYITTLGSYYFVQDPSATQIAASKSHISISNQEDGNSSTVTSIRSISAGLLRNAKRVVISITEDSTGKTVYEQTSYNQRKSHSSGGTIYASSIDVDFVAAANNLKNNTQYTVTVKAYIDYGDGGEENNARNTFTFPLYVDFQAPVVTGVNYRSEYDKTTKKTKLYADISVYDNHYAMGMSVGQIIPADPSTGYAFTMQSFGKYVTPIYSSFNSTSKIIVELTDYVSQIKQSAGISYDKDGNAQVEYNNNSFIVTCYDYAMNSATYQLRLPDEILSLNFTESEINLSPYETADLTRLLSIYPDESWAQTLEYEIENGDYLAIANQTLIAKANDSEEIKTTYVTARGKDADGNIVEAKLKVNVLYKGHPNYKRYTVPDVNKFEVTGYTTERAFHGNSSDEREIGVTGGSYEFGESNSLSMFPSEQVKINYTLDVYFPDGIAVVFKSGNSSIAKVSADGVITAVAEGNTAITVTVTKNGKNTIYTKRVPVSVKDPFTTNSIYLMSYKGEGETVNGETNVVVIPDNRGITTIYSYAFSGYEYVEKDLDAGDVIDKEDPYYIKQMYIGDDRIKKIVIPEGVTTIESYAFANLTALEEVVMPSTLTRIGVGAFYGCKNLKKINLNYAKFINEKAFAGCSLESVSLDNVVAIGNYTFQGNTFSTLTLPMSSQSLGIGAFKDCKNLTFVTFVAPKMKIGSSAFEGCSALKTVNVNAAVISSSAFAGCTNLSDVTIGKDVTLIGEYAFANTAVKAFKLEYGNASYVSEENGVILSQVGSDGRKTLCLVAPSAKTSITTDADYIGAGAFAGSKIQKVTATKATYVGAYAFAGCSNFWKGEFSNVTEIGDYAFYGTQLKETPDLSNVEKIGRYAFATSNITSVTVPANCEVGEYAFAYCNALTNVTVGNGAVIGAYAFANTVNVKNTYEYIIAKLDNDKKTNAVINAIFNTYYELYDYEIKNDKGEVTGVEKRYRYKLLAQSKSYLETVTIGDDVILGEYAFAGNPRMTTLNLGNSVEIGDYAFFDANALTAADLSSVKSVGAYAFAGSRTKEYSVVNRTLGDAYNFKDEEGKSYAGNSALVTGYAYTSFAPSLTSVDLSSATYIGTGAFAFQNSLASVTLGENVTEISDYAFAFDKALSQVAITATEVTAVGGYAFYGTALTSFDVSGVAFVGDYAFALTNITAVTLKEGAKIGDGTFMNCRKLASVGNIDKAVAVGAYAFAGTAITKADITAAQKIGDFAFAGSKITSVTFGEALNEIGENPFAGCEIATYGKTETVTIKDGYDVETLVIDYSIGNGIYVEGGVIYKTAQNGGKILVSYPAADTATSYTVASGTVRISARAFENAKLNNVILSSELKAIGDKAFYGCEKLSTVVFTSYNAPSLEEEFDSSYMTTANTPSSANGGLGITGFYMWNVSSRNSNYFYGANFVDYIGKIKSDIVMVKPSNGQGYDSFIFSKYFATIVNGGVAATEQTLNVIAIINALPASINLSCEAQVVAARNAYESITSLEQKALVSNYTKLTSAENTIQYLKNRDNPDEPDNPDMPDNPNSSSNTKKFGCKSSLGQLGWTAGFAACAIAVYAIISKKKKEYGNRD